MPKINRIRLVNYRYNDGTRIWLDKTFKLLQGENTLFTLVNGGGKTVLIQGILQAINPNTNLGDRQWKGFFDKPDQPCYIMVEWLLDDNSGYATTGAAFQKDGSGVKYYGFVTQYDQPGSDLDIQHLPVSNKDAGVLKFVKYRDTKAWLSKKRDYYRDMGRYSAVTISDTKKEHRARLRELNINPAEWSNLMVEINKLEGGMNKVFEGCTTTESVMRQLILKEVEAKLTREQSLVQGDYDGFELFDRSREHLKHLARDQSRLEDERILKGNLETFNEEVRTRFLPQKTSYKTLVDNRFNGLRTLLSYHQQFAKLTNQLAEKQQQLNRQEEELRKAFVQIDFEEASRRYHTKVKEYEAVSEDVERLSAEEQLLNQEVQALEMRLRTIAASNYYFKIQHLESQLASKERILKESQEKGTDLAQKIKVENRKMKYLLSIEEKKIKREVSSLEGDMESVEHMIQDFIESEAQCQDDLNQIRNQIGVLKAKLEAFDKKYNQVGQKYPDWIAFDADLSLIQQQLMEKQVKDSQELNQIKKWLLDTQQRLMEIEKELTQLNDLYLKKNGALGTVQNECQNIKQAKQMAYQRLLDFYELMPDGAPILLELSEDDVYDKHKNLHRMEEFISKTESDKNILVQQIAESKKCLAQLETGFYLDIPQALTEWFEQENIVPIRGVDYLKEHHISEDYLKHSIIPHSLLVTDQEAIKINQVADTFIADVFIPILTRSQLKLLLEDENSSLLVEEDNISWLANFNPQWLDDTYVEELKKQIRQDLIKLDTDLSRIKTKLKRANLLYGQYSDFSIDRVHEAQLLTKLDQLQRDIEEVQNQQSKANRQRLESLTQKGELEKEEKKLAQDLSTLAQSLQDISEFIESSNENVVNEKMLDEQESRLAQQTSRLKDIQRNKIIQEARVSDLKINISIKESVIGTLQSDLSTLKLMSPVETSESIEMVREYLGELKRQYGNYSLEAIEDEIKTLTKDIADNKKNLELEAAKTTEDYQAKKWSTDEKKLVEQRQDDVKKDLKQTSKVLTTVRDEQVKLIATIDEILGQIQKTYKQEPFESDKIDPDFKGRRNHTSKLMNENEQEKTETGKQSDYVGKLNRSVELSLERVPVELREMANESLTLSSMETIVVQLSGLSSLESLLNGEVQKLDTVLRAIKKFEEAWVQDLDNLIHKNSSVHVFKNLIFMLRTEQSFKKNDVEKVLNALSIQLEVNNVSIKKLEKDLEGIEQSKEEFIKDCTTHIENIYREIKLFGRNISIQWEGSKKNLINLTIPQRTDDLTLKVKTYTEGLVNTLVNYYKTDRGDEVDGYILKSINMISLLELITTVSDYRLHLFKVEIVKEQSAYKRWEDLVVKASGGERFFASFILCAALLTYSRSGQVVKDMQKIGKVLLMDNPFGVVTSSHLLNPVFELANQLNIQMICLTGINDINIFNHFRLIYALRIETVEGGKYSYLENDTIDKIEAPQSYQHYEKISLFD